MIHATQSYFAGDWLMVRIIENAPEGIIGEVWGEARFVEDGDGLACHETGVLRFHGEDYHTERRSLWRFPEPGRVEVFHADGRPFHHFLAERPIALEFSGDATYEIVYDFEPDTWISRWEMAEAERIYLMTTRYRRPAAALSAPAPDDRTGEAAAIRRAPAIVEASVFEEAPVFKEDPADG